MGPQVKAFFGHFGNFYEWFNASDDDPPEYRRLPETLDYLEQVMAEQGPFDGIVGFSQGGSIAHLVAFLQAAGERFANAPKLKFVIIISARRSRAAAHQPLWSSPADGLGLPRTLVIYGGMDANVKPEETRGLI